MFVKIETKMRLKNIIEHEKTISCIESEKKILMNKNETEQNKIKELEQEKQILNNKINELENKVDNITNEKQILNNKINELETEIQIIKDKKENDEKDKHVLYTYKLVKYIINLDKKYKMNYCNYILNETVEFTNRINTVDEMVDALKCSL